MAAVDYGHSSSMDMKSMGLEEQRVPSDSKAGEEFPSDSKQSSEHYRHGSVVDIQMNAVHDDGTVDYAVGEITKDITLDTSLQLVTLALDITDDPTQSPFTFRAFVIGLGLAAFGAVSFIAANFCFLCGC